MRICFCIDYLGGGGAERVMSLLANQMCFTGHKVFLIETSSSKADKPFYHLDESVEHIYLKTVNKKISLMSKVFRLRKQICKIKPDVVISFKYSVNIYTSVALLFKKIPHIVSERNDPYSYSENLLERILKKRTFRCADGCVFQTNDALKFYYNKPNRRCAIIKNPLGNDLSFCSPVNRKNVILYVGRLEKQKNTKLLIDAFDKIWVTNRQLILKIYGEGSLKEKLVSYCSTLQSSANIIFCGLSKTWKNDEKDAKMFVLPSNYEGMPNSLMEAMAIGIPSISTDCPCGAPRELIKDMVNGILVPTNDVRALYHAMLTLLNNMKIANDISNSNRHMIDEYSVSTITEKWVEFIDEIIGSRGDNHE